MYMRRQSCSSWYLSGSHHPHFKSPGASHTLFSLLAADNHAYFRTFVIASIAGIYSLFPLLFTPAGESHSYSRLFLLTNVTETPIALIYSLLWAALVVRPLSKRVYEYAISESPLTRTSC